MATKRWILSFLTITVIAALAGCNSGSTFNPQNPPPPPPADALGIAFQPPPPTSILISAATPITAIVTNDTTNGGSGSGIDWTVTCQSGNCGTISPAHTASGEAATYTPPASLTGNSEIVNIEGFATADSTKNILTSIDVTAFGSNFSGTYVIQAQGVESAQPYQLAGVIVLDGKGNITGGEQTVNLLNQNTGNYESHTDSSTTQSSTYSGTYFLGPDGRGTLTINLSDPAIVQETFSIAFLSNSHALIAATPAPNVAAINTPTASGTMDLQASTIGPLSGGYAFVASGTDSNGSGPAAIGGILNVDSPNTISGVGSAADQDLAGILVTSKRSSGTVTSPDPFGLVTFNLSIPLFPVTNTYQFAGYIVDSTHIKLIETDNSGAGAIAGQALGQGSAAGTFTDDSSFSGTYVFGVLGTDLSIGTPDTLTSAGVFTADGGGNLTNGYTDTVFQSFLSMTTGAPVQISSGFDGTYDVVPAGFGRLRAFFRHFDASIKGYTPEYIFYLAGNGNPALVLAVGNTSNTNYPFLGTGIAYPQTSNLTFSGNYGFSFVQQNGTEFDGTGEMTVTPPSLSGVADVGVNVAQDFTGSVSSQTCSPNVVGCFPGFFSGSAFTDSFTADFYIIDQTQGFFIETDLVQQQPPQVTLGYFAASVPPAQPSSNSLKTTAKRRLR